MSGNNGAVALARRATNGQDDGFAEMLAGARANVPSACRLLYESLAGRVLGYLRLHDADDAEDLTSEVFLRVFTHLREFEGDADGLRAWVFTIAHRALIDDRRRYRRRPQTVALSEARAASLVGGDAEADAIRAVERDEMWARFDGLTVDQRDVLALRIVADLSIEDVARVVGKPTNSVKALQHRAIAALRRQLEATEDEC
jgi:RNA polymerase sigma-70 factor (ECF subfamily)